MSDKRIFELTEAQEIDENDLLIIDRSTFSEAKSVKVKTLLELVPGAVYTINITTTESTLYGQTVTATYDSDKTKTAVFSNAGTATIRIPDYIGNIYISATNGTDIAEAIVTTVHGTTTYSVTLLIGAIYGVNWDGSTTSAFTRTDDAELFSDPSPAVNNGNGSSPFDSILPWGGMEVVSDPDAGELVKIPKFYYKWTKSGSAMKLQISTKQHTGFHISPAHGDRGDGTGERNYVYVGRYHCASDYKSTTGVLPKVNITRATARSGIHNLGTDIWQYDFAMFWTILMLYLVEYANWNSQNMIGYGCAPTGSTSAVRNVGYTDAMAYHTGTDQPSRSTYGGTQYRHIEGLWDNCCDWCDGVLYNGSSRVNVGIIYNPSGFSDTTGATIVGTRATSIGDIKSFFTPSVSGLEWALYPSEVVSDSTYNTYICDECSYDRYAQVLDVGGSYYQWVRSGAFSIHGWNEASTSGDSIGCRLMKLPN